MAESPPKEPHTTVNIDLLPAAIEKVSDSCHHLEEQIKPDASLLKAMEGLQRRMEALEIEQKELKELLGGIASKMSVTKGPSRQADNIAAHEGGIQAAETSEGTTNVLTLLVGKLESLERVLLDLKKQMKEGQEQANRDAKGKVDFNDTANFAEAVVQIINGVSKLKTPTQEEEASRVETTPTQCYTDNLRSFEEFMATIEGIEGRVTNGISIVDQKLSMTARNLQAQLERLEQIMALQFERLAENSQPTAAGGKKTKGKAKPQSQQHPYPQNISRGPISLPAAVADPNALPHAWW